METEDVVNQLETVVLDKEDKRSAAVAKAALEQITGPFPRQPSGPPPAHVLVEVAGAISKAAATSRQAVFAELPAELPAQPPAEIPVQLPAEPSAKASAKAKVKFIPNLANPAEVKMEDAQRQTQPTRRTTSRTQ